LIGNGIGTKGGAELAPAVSKRKCRAPNSTAGKTKGGLAMDFLIRLEVMNMLKVIFLTNFIALLLLFFWIKGVPFIASPLCDIPLLSRFEFYPRPRPIFFVHISVSDLRHELPDIPQRECRRLSKQFQFLSEYFSSLPPMLGNWCQINVSSAVKLTPPKSISNDSTAFDQPSNASTVSNGRASILECSDSRCNITLRQWG
jgi:hypothetical protein